MLNQLIPQQLLIPFIATPQRTALKSKPLPNKRRNIYTFRQLRTPHQPQTDNATIHPRRVQIALEIACTDEVDDEIHAFSISHFEEFCRPVLCAVVESSCCAEFANTEVDFLGRGRGYVDGLRAVGFRELDARD